MLNALQEFWIPVRGETNDANVRVSRGAFNVSFVFLGLLCLLTLQLVNAALECVYNLLRKCAAYHQFDINTLVPVDSSSSTYKRTAFTVASYNSSDRVRSGDQQDFVHHLLAIKADPHIADSNGASKAHFDVAFRAFGVSLLNTRTVLQLVHSLEETYCTVRQIKKLLKAFILEECKAKNERVLNINTLVAVEPCGFGQFIRYYARPPLIAEAKHFNEKKSCSC